MAKRRTSIAIEFTPEQLDVMVTALAHCTHGSPSDIGMKDNAEGWKVLTVMELVHDNVVAIREAAVL